MTTESLFEGFDVPVAAEDTTPGERRRLRHLAAINAGQHPLSTLFGHMPLLEGSSATCGDCVHRIQRGGASKRYPKCDLPGRQTRGEATDIRAWWPACREFELPTPASSDAAREKE